MSENNISSVGKIKSEDVHSVIGQSMLADGMDMVLDLQNSSELTLKDSRRDKEFLDLFSFFASTPLGMNHPRINNPEFIHKIGQVALNKPSNSDIYTVEMAEFVDTFNRIAKPDYMKYLFLISGGSLAVENGLKVAFDWKVQKNFEKGYTVEKGQMALHFKEAFHGRSGYTMSLTNTDPTKIKYFPKFKWPRVNNPKITFPLEDNLEQIIKSEEESIRQINAAISANIDDIAVIIIEVIQAEGGDNFFRKEFLQQLRDIADEHEILLMFDEVQTGIGITGKMWAHEHYVKPDIVSFGKKAQVCGIMVTDRIDDVEEHCFRKSSRINSTWGGNLVDMVRSTRFLEIIAEENLLENAERVGKYLLERIKELQTEFPELVFQARGLGLLCAFDFPTQELRNKFLAKLYENGVVMLGCGTKSVRFRPPLNIKTEHVDKGIEIIRQALKTL
ncbi:MAG: L-lysine 6-transaminase [Bacteroidetes bacterium]|nr:L-lysine 6-transaminase [Bacteroidota bacterium]